MRWADRFWPKVRMTHTCWIWVGSRCQGYGNFRLNGKTVAAHRVSYEHFNGPLKDGLQIDHLCRNRACINPAHLEAVTPRVNVLRGVGPTAENAKKTHCHRGHALVGPNLYIRKNGTRRCMECNRICRRKKTKR